MSIFTLKKYELVQGRQPFYTLSEDDTCQYENYCNDLVSNPAYQASLRSILANMVRIANGEKVAREKFHPYDIGVSNAKVCEFKAGDLRVYALQEDGTGKIIILGGYKNQQKADERQVKSLVQRYIASRT
jgi:hypothetical protein